MNDIKSPRDFESICVIVTGSVRSRLETLQVFSELSKLLSEGSLKRVVASVWNDEIEIHKTLFDTLARQGVEIIGNERAGNSSFEAQLIPFYSALSLFGDEDFVVRVRTDKCFPILIPFLARRTQLARCSLQIAESSVFSSKVVVPAVSLNEPFAHGDFLFMAKARDLRKLCHLDAYFDLFANNPNAETRWFSRPYIFSYPDIRIMMEKFSNIELARSLWNFSSSTNPKEAKNILPLPLARFLGRYLYLCSRDFLLIDNYNLPDDFDSTSAYSWSDHYSWRWGPRVFINSQKYLDKIWQGADDSLIGEQIELASKSDLSTSSLNVNDIEEISLFVEKYADENERIVNREKKLSTNYPVYSSNFTLPTLTSYEIFIETCKSIDNRFDRQLISSEVERLITEALDGTNELFGSMNSYVTECRATAEKILKKLETDHTKFASPQLNIIPALFYEASLVFGWDAQAGKWLAEKILSGVLSDKFASITRWGLVSRHWILPPDVLYLTSQLVADGVGGPKDAALSAMLRENAIKSGYNPDQVANP